MAPLRRPLTGILTGLLVVLWCLGPATSAAADPGYRYWGYYHADSGSKQWTLAKTGPEEFTPADGSVEGWRFAISVGLSGREPRVAPHFAAICAGTPAEQGKKRVAVVLDFGLAEEAPDGDRPPKPRGACAVVPDARSGGQVLQAVADVRVGKDGFTCGIDGYPASECPTELNGVSVPARDKPVDLQLPRSATADASPPAAADQGFPLAPVAVAVLALAIGAAGWLMLRRRA